MYEGIWKNAHDSNVKLFLEALYMIILWNYNFFWKKNSPSHRYMHLKLIYQIYQNTKLMIYISFKANFLLFIYDIINKLSFFFFLSSPLRWFSTSMYLKYQLIDAKGYFFFKKNYIFIILSYMKLPKKV